MKIKQILLYFFWATMILLWAFGAFNGVVVTILQGYWHTAIAIVAIAWLAWPKVNEYRKNLMPD